MTDREKLAKLIGEAINRSLTICSNGNIECPDCPGYGDRNCHDLLRADYLLANGVTVREPGRWEDIEGSIFFRCSCCKRICPYDYDFCPNCGAPMTGGHA